MKKSNLKRNYLKLIFTYYWKPIVLITIVCLIAVFNNRDYCKWLFITSDVSNPYILFTTISLLVVYVWYYFEYKDKPYVINLIDVLMLLSEVFFIVYIFIKKSYIFPSLLGTVVTVAVIVNSILLIMRARQIRTFSDEIALDNVNDDNCRIMQLSELLSKSDEEMEQLREDYLKDNKLLLLNEKSDTKDIFEREDISNYLVDCMQSSSHTNSFTIGLEGEWGSGKTTLLNIAKKQLREQNENIAIVDLDMMMFGNEGAFVTSFVDALCKGLNLQLGTLQMKKTITFICDMFMAINPQYKSLELLKYGNFNDTNVALKTIRHKLINRKDPLVVCIDNLDRSSADNIILLFRMMDAYFDLPNLVYVLLYDRRRLEEIFDHTLNCNNKYYEKIITQVITIPKESTTMYNEIHLEALERFEFIYTGSKRLNYQVLIEFLDQQKINLRTFKRYINTVMPLVFRNKLFLHYYDLLILMTIKFFNQDLFEFLNKNYEYIASDAKEIIVYDTYRQFQNVYDVPEIKVIKSEVINTIKETYSEYVQLLASIFSSIEGRGDIKTENFNYSDKISELNRIDNYAATPLYFSFGREIYLTILEETAKLVKELENCHIYEIEEIIAKSFIDRTKDNVYIDAWMYFFSNMMAQLSKEKLKIILTFMFDNASLYDNDNSFNGFRTSRIALFRFIEHGLKLLGNEEMKLVKKWFDESNDIFSLDYLINMNYKYGHYELKKLLKEKIYKVVDDEHPINIFSDKYFYEGNLFIVGRYLEDNEYTKLFDYLLKFLDSENIYRMTYEMLNGIYKKDSHVYKCHYKFGDNYQDFVKDHCVEMKNCFDQRKPSNKSEEKILEIFENYIETLEFKEIEFSEKIYYSEL